MGSSITRLRRITIRNPIPNSKPNITTTTKNTIRTLHRHQARTNRIPISRHQTRNRQRPTNMPRNPRRNRLQPRRRQRIRPKKSIRNSPKIQIPNSNLQPRPKKIRLHIRLARSLQTIPRIQIITHRKYQPQKSKRKKNQTNTPRPRLFRKTNRFRITKTKKINRIKKTKRPRRFLLAPNNQKHNIQNIKQQKHNTIFPPQRMILPREHKNK